MVPTNFEKYARQIGSFPQGENKKYCIWNHHLESAGIPLELNNKGLSRVIIPCLSILVDPPANGHKEGITLFHRKYKKPSGFFQFCWKKSRISWDIHPGKLTWNPKMEVGKMMFLFYWVIFGLQPLIFRGVFETIPIQKRWKKNLHIRTWHGKWPPPSIKLGSLEVFHDTGWLPRNPPPFDKDES